VSSAGEARRAVSGAGVVTGRAISVRVDTRIGLVAEARVVRTSGVGTVCVTGQARGVASGAVCGAGVVAGGANAVRVDTRVSLVGSARVVRASRVGAVSVAAS
jgi:hypothetical protein